MRIWGDCRPFPVARDVRFKLPLDVEQTLAFQGHRPICDFGLVYLRADGLDQIAVHGGVVNQSGLEVCSSVQCLDDALLIEF